MVSSRPATFFFAFSFVKVLKIHMNYLLSGKNVFLYQLISIELKISENLSLKLKIATLEGHLETLRKHIKNEGTICLQSRKV